MIMPMDPDGRRGNAIAAMSGMVSSTHGAGVGFGGALSERTTSQSETNS